MAAVNLKLPPFWPSATEVRDLHQPNTHTTHRSNSLSSAQPPPSSEDYSSYSMQKIWVIANQHNYCGECNSCWEIKLLQPIHGAFLRELFLQRLPTNVRMVLASTSDTTSVEELAQLADKITDVTSGSSPSVSAMQAPSPNSDIEQLRAEVSRLKGLVTCLSSRSRPPRHRSPTPPRPRSHSPTEVPLCWYHQWFGDAARNCKALCAKAGNALASR